MFSNNLLMAAAGGGGADYVIENSVLLNDDDSAYIYRTPGSAGDRQTWTISMWVKRGELGAINYVWHTTGGYDFGVFNPDDTLRFNFYTSNNKYMTTNRVFRDTSAWYHLVFTADSTSATTTITGAATDRLRLWVNGVQESSFSTTVVPAQNSESTRWNNTYLNSISSSAAGYFDGYLADIHFVDGTALAASDFGEFDTNGEWVPIEPSGLTYGTNGFYLDFAVAPGTGNGAGTDVSGNGNNFTDSGLTASDQRSDSPTNDADNGIGNYCTWNPLASSTGTFSEGNLAATGFNGNYSPYGTDSCARGTIPIPLTGKHYFEVHSTGYTGDDCSVGIMPIEVQDGRSYNAGLDAYVLYQANVTPSVWPYFQTIIDGVTTNTDQAQINNTAFVWQVAYDADNGKIWFGIDDTWVDGGDPSAGTGEQASSIPARNYTPSMGGTTASFVGTLQATDDDLTYTPPTGFSTNFYTARMPTPAIPDPTKHCQVELVNHDGTSTAFTCNWDADVYDTLFIIKNRDSTEAWYLVDGLNGYNKYTQIQTTTQQTDANVISVSGTTCTLGSTLADDGYVVECHKAGLSASRATNSGGTNTTTTSYNSTSKFVIGTYPTGASPSGGDTIEHGMAAAPEFMHFHKLGADGTVVVWHHLMATTANTGGMGLDGSGGFDVSANYWNDTSPDATTVTLGASTAHNAASENYVFYGWIGVEGYSAFKNYDGNANTDGSFVYTGIRSLIHINRSTEAVGNWVIMNTLSNPGNPADLAINYDLTTLEQSYADLDILSNGIKIRSGATGLNASGKNYITCDWGRPLQGPKPASNTSEGRAR
jgi:hypothetical protein